MQRPSRIVLVILLVSAVCSADSAAQTPPASTVLANVRREFDRVRDYTADMNAVIDVPGIKAPPMKARIWFKQPDRVHFEADGFAMLPRDAVSFNPRMFREDLYDAVVQGEETIDGTPCIKVKLLAKSDTLRLQRAMLYVDPARWLILRMTTDPSEGGSADITLTYAYIDNRYFLPARVQLRMDAPSRLPHGPRMNRPQNGAEPAQKKPARITITYTNYRVNAGIPDDVFTRKNTKE